MLLVDLLYFAAFVLLGLWPLHAVFTPNTKDYDAYGPKIAMNRHLLVLAQNSYQPPTFAVQFAPYNQSLSASQCSISYPNTSNTFIDTVAIGKQQSPAELHFFFAGEHTNGQTGSFIGMATLNLSQTTTMNLTSSICNNSLSYSLYYLDYDHQDYSVLGAHPQGHRAYEFANEYIAMFDVHDASAARPSTWDGYLTWLDRTFTPHAVDISDDFGIVAGFVRNNITATTTTAQYSPMIYLIRFNSTDHHPFVVDQYKPVPMPGTWQDLLTTADANIYSAKYDMSVSINDEGQVLVGMQFINRVFLLTVNVSDAVRLQYISRFTNGRSIGNGKSVAWLDNGIAAILVNVYTLDYVWSSSQVYLFDIREHEYNSNSTPLSVFPNSHQLLPSGFGAEFLNVVSSPSSLALLSNNGNIIIFTPTPPEYYPFIEVSNSSPLITIPRPCMVGTFKNKSGVHDCVLCPTGTKNAGNSSNACTPCRNESFCPLASVADVPQSALEPLYQAVPYPQSPESIVFDEILLWNVFSIVPARCLTISPLFWALIVAGIAIAIIITMEILKLFVKNSRSKRIRHVVKRILIRTDLIGQGELWIGGLVSFSIVVLVSFGFFFSSNYLKQYPIENSSDAYFTCDRSTRNAKFDTNVQSTAIPPVEHEKQMFALLNNQTFTLNLDFINTLVSCDVISIQALFGLTWSTIRWLDCNNTDAILTLAIPLSYRLMSVRVLLEDTKTIGALRIGLYGDGQQNEKYTLRQLHFEQSFWQNEYIVSYAAPVALVITKIINETKPIEGDDSTYSGIYVPTFTVDMDSLFMSNSQYVLSSSTMTILTVSISETPYYVKNVQQPIARKSEIIFHNILFTIACLEIFGLLFLSYKLVFKPLYGVVMKRLVYDRWKETSYRLKRTSNSDSMKHSLKVDEKTKDYVSTVF